jgi:3-dehydroquinate dehydratase/shikimate dehydrogenase
MRQTMPITDPTPCDSPLLPAASARPAENPGKICVALQASTPAELIERAQAALADALFLEFRLDALPAPADALEPLRAFLAAHPEVTAIGTCRLLPHGGSFAGSLAQELELLAQSAEAGCRIVDLEIESAELAKPAQLDALRQRLRAAGTQLLVSFHDFRQTHNLEFAVNRIRAFRPDFTKVVSTAHRLSDNLAVLRLIEERSPSSRLVALAMGEEGIVSRVLGPRAGAAFTFASAGAGIETAPGQFTAQTLRDLFHVEQLDLQTRIFAVIGNPIAHSLSPLMQNAAFRAQDLNAILLPLKVTALDDLLTLLLELPLHGVAVTMPLKVEILPHLATMDPLTRRIGACNTLRVLADGSIEGFNTDVAGVVRPLEKRLPLKGAKIAVLGAGGAARAAVFGLVDQGAEVFIVNRTHASAMALAAESGAAALKHEALASRRFDVLINSTPCGMKDARQPLPIAAHELNADLVFDLVYNPLQTPLLKLAAQRGIPTIGGIEMFVQQGARQFELWTGKTAPEAEMLRVVEGELRKRG